MSSVLLITAQLCVFVRATRNCVCAVMCASVFVSMGRHCVGNMLTSAEGKEALMFNQNVDEARNYI